MRKWSKTQRTGVMLSCILTVTALLVLIALAWQGDTEKETYKLIFIPKTIDSANGFWTSLIDGAELGAEEFGAEIEVFGAETEDDVEKQIELVRLCIGKKPDALLIAPGDYSLVTDVLREAKESGIKVILLDSLIDQNIADAIVCTDNYLAGKELGEYTQTLLNEKSKIGIVAHVKGTSTAVERESGIRDGLGTYESQVEEVVFCNSSYERAYALTEEMLAKHPDMNVIIGTNEYAAVGAARAVKDLGLENRVKMVGFDSSVEEIQFLEEGIFQAIIIQKPFNMGYLGVEQAIKLITNRELEYSLDSGCKLITRDNLYEEENQMLLYPFSGQ